MVRTELMTNSFLQTFGKGLVMFVMWHQKGKVGGQGLISHLVQGAGGPGFLYVVLQLQSFLVAQPIFEINAIVNS